jgi:glycosyltransferase involved in cell wall biosynthesis
MLKMFPLFQSLPESLLAKADAGRPCREISFDRPMRIGILGSRGIPNAYGGFEQFAQYLSRGLVQRGHPVWVYNSSDHPYREKEWEGVHIIHCKDWDSRIGSAGQFIYDYNCFMDARKRDFDILLQLGYTSNSIWHRLWPKGPLHVINMDGLEWKRAKYGPITRRFLFRAEKWAVRHGQILIADSAGIRDYIEEKYRKPVIYIPYGAEIPECYDAGQLRRWDLKPDGYHLLMARMEPENNIETIIRGWLASGKEKPLVLIGNAGNSFGMRLQNTYRHEKLLFIGPIYHAEVANTLRHYSSLYFHGHSVGGTNPSLLEAMACRAAIIAHDNSFNKEVLGKEAGYFSSAEDITGLLEKPPERKVASGWKRINAEKVRNLYTWDGIVDGYLKLFSENLSRQREKLQLFK